MTAMRDFAAATYDLGHALAMGGMESVLAEHEAKANEALAVLLAESADA